MTRSRRTAGCIFTAVACLLAGAARVDAGAMGVPCIRPLVFTGAAVNVVFLPYRYAGDELKVTETSVKISALAQIETLFSIAKYGSVGAVQLTAQNENEDKECTPEIVARKLLGQQPGAAAQLAPGRSAVLAWGRFYEESGQTYVQTYVRMITRGAPVDAVDVTVAGHRFSGRLSETGFAFTPRLVSRGDLDEIQRRAADAIRVYDAPDSSSRSVPMQVDSSKPIVYSVNEVRGEWMLIDTRLSGPSGWVRGDVLADGWSLRRRMPEFIFIEGMVGFLKARSDAASPDAAARGHAIATLRRVFDEFNAAKVRIASPAPLALAVGLQMVGTLQLRPDASAEEIASAEQSFSEAASLVPYSADAINLQLMARLLLATTRGSEISNARDYVDRWTNALARDPGNRDAIDNLQTFLEWLDADAARTPRQLQGAPEPEEIRKWLSAARSVSRTRSGGR